MAHLWHYQNDQWQPVHLAGPVLALSADGWLRPVTPSGPAPVQLRAAGNDWVLLAGPAARIVLNGEPLGLGCRVLRDRDEIVLGSMRAYFSTERLAAIEPFPDTNEAPVICARCRLPIVPASPAVRCPGCGTWCHEDAEKHSLCWSYEGACPLCPQPTGTDVGYRWEPGF